MLIQYIECCIAAHYIIRKKFFCAQSSGALELCMLFSSAHHLVVQMITALSYSGLVVRTWKYANGFKRNTSINLISRHVLAVNLNYVECAERTHRCPIYSLQSVLNAAWVIYAGLYLGHEALSRSRRPTSLYISATDFSVFSFQWGRYTGCRTSVDRHSLRHCQTFCPGPAEAYG
jgi:hypothetical protein